MDGRGEQHPLTLRVMQLAKPTFSSKYPVMYDDEGTHLTNSILHPGCPRLFSQTIVTEELQLPSSQGKVFLGESFSAFINVCNDSREVVTNVAIRVEIQTENSRHVIQTNPDKLHAVKLEPDQTVEGTIRHDLRDLGEHSLICAVSYTLLTGDRRSFRKSFNFDVNQPLDVTPHSSTIKDKVVLEIQIKNLMPYPVHFQSIKFSPNSAFTMIDCNICKGKDNKMRSIFHGFPVVDTNECRSYLFILHPAEGQFVAFRQTSSVGKLDLMWRSTMGEFGHLQTSQLSRQIPPIQDIEIYVKNIPSKVFIGDSFEVVCDIVNFREMKSDIRLDFDIEQGDKTGLILIGTATRSIGSVPPLQSMQARFQFTATKMGILSCQGFTLYDVGRTRSFPVFELFQVRSITFSIVIIAVDSQDQ
eukprot:gene10001-2175_t